MTGVLVAIDEPRATALAAELELEGLRIVAVAPPTAIIPLPAGVDVVIVPATRGVLGPKLIDACDRAGARILPLGDGEHRTIARYGLAEPLSHSATGWEIAAALAVDAPPTAGTSQDRPHRVIAVWGPAGSPGRSTVAIQLAVELSRLGRRTALVDADTVAPSIALLLGLSDDDPGVAAACRRADLGALDSTELERISAGVDTSGGTLDVLGGINRPSRWPELSAARLTSTLRECRTWAEETIVDVSAALDADDEATYDLAGPRRHAATAATLAEADLIIAVASADPLGISRFLREHAELRRLAAPTPVRVVVNRLRSGPLGLDARGQVRRTLERFAGITDVSFLPTDQRAADAALLHARPMADVVPRSPLVAGIRRLAATLVPAIEATGGSSRGSSRAARSPARARAVRGA